MSTTGRKYGGGRVGDGRGGGDRDRIGVGGVSRPRDYVRDLAAIAGVALGLRLALALALPVVPAWDGALYARGASHLVRDGSYTQRAIRDDAPARASAFYPVGWPAVLAVVRVVFPSAGAGSAAGHAADLVLQSLFGAAAAAGAYLLGRRARGRRSGLLAGLLVALMPGSVLLCASWLAEPLFTALLVLAALPIAYARRKRRLRALALSALVLGVAAYVRPVALPIALLLAFASARRLEGSRAKALAASLVVVTCGVLAPLAPWIARNAAVMHAPVLVSTNGGANLLLGTVGDGRYGSIPAVIDCPHGLREVDRDRCRTARALTRLRVDPVGAFTRAARKLFDTFGYEVSPALVVEAELPAHFPARHVLANVAAGVSTLAWLVLVALALESARRAALPSAVRDFTLAATMGTALLHALFLGGDRYHLPLVPLFAVHAAALLVSIRAASRRDRRSRPHASTP